MTQTKITQVLESLAKATTDNYLECAVIGLSGAVGANFVYVADVDFKRHEANTIALCEQGKLIPNFQYSLVDTPCENVAGDALCICEHGVSRDYPDDRLLEEMSIEGYIGMPLYDKGKEVLGILVALYTRPISNPEEVTTLFRLFSNMIAMELGRMQAEDKQRINEERYRDLYDNAPNAYFSISMEGNVIRCNSRAEEMLGYTTQELEGMPVLELYASTPEGAGKAQKILKKLRTGETVRNQELQMQKRDGSTFWISLTVNMVLSADGQQQESRSVVVDITERKQIEEALRRSQKMEAIGQLTGGIAHDFNNILGIIIGNISLLKDQVSSDEKALKRVVKIDKSAGRAADLVKQLMGFSRLQVTDVVVSNINQVILDMDSLIKRSITPAVDVDMQLIEDPWSIVVNLGDFQDAILNLILNARDAMPDGGQLAVQTRNYTLDAAYCAQHPNLVAGEYAQLIVSDSGTGMTPGQLDKIYDPFYTTKPAGKGTGLGLSMLFGFVTRSKGHIDVQSKPGTGTTFNLYLPRAIEQAQLDSITDREPEALPQGTETILAVDDEEELLELARESLETLGYHVFTASNGKEALKILADHPAITLLFSDVVMPGGIHGYELAQQAMENHSGLKVLLTSGHAEKAKSKADSEVNLLMKPYSHEGLAQRVRSILGEPQTASTRYAEQQTQSP